MGTTTTSAICTTSFNAYSLFTSSENRVKGKFDDHRPRNNEFVIGARRYFIDDLQCPIGRGGFSRVFKGYCETTLADTNETKNDAKVVAIKYVDLPSQESSRRRVEREVFFFSV